MKHLLLSLLAFYQKSISPALGNNCRFTPTCSEYARIAISQHGSVVGLFLSAKRLLRCHPLCKGGYDPVPKRPFRSRTTTRLEEQ